MNIFTPIGIFVWWFMLRPDDTLPYIVAGAVGLLVTTYGYRTFDQLMAITQEANKFANSVQKMAKTHSEIKGEVGKIGIANGELKETEDRLRAANAKNRENLDNFNAIQTTMKQLEVKSFQEVTKTATKLKQSWHDSLMQKERDMLHTIFDRYEMQNDKDGMTESEFNEFAKCLPEAYQKKFAALGTFDKLSDGDGVLEYADFEMALDLFAEMVVDNVDIDFVVKKEEIVDPDQLEQLTKMAVSATRSESYSLSSEEDDGIIGNMWNKLATWRQTRKQEKIRNSINVSRRLLIHARTPTPTGDDNVLSFPSTFPKNNDDPTSLSPRYQPSKSTFSKQSTLSPVTQEQNNLLAQPNKKQFTKPTMPIPSVSALNLMDSKDIDDADYNDDEMNAYMKKMQNQ